MLRFLLNDSLVTETDVAADVTVLDYLRDHRQMCGTKEGCASGDCGACTAVIATVENGCLQYRSINTCITLLGSLHGCQLITVEHLQDGSVLHPVQRAMVDCHGSQCGFCTPGFVMSLFALSKNLPDAEHAGNAAGNRIDQTADHTTTEHTAEPKALAMRYLGGNLCRCTGYRPIMDAAMQIMRPADRAVGLPDKFEKDTATTINLLNSIEPVAESNGFFRPANISELCELRSRYPSAPLLAGGTDLSLEITQRLKQFDQVICLQQVSGLEYLTSDSEQLYIGPGCTIADLVDGLRHLGLDIVNLLHRFGATQVRSQATVGGSIANASPIGDLAPVFISMGAKVLLESIDGQRSMPLEDYFVDYRQTQLRDNEIVREIQLPRGPNTEADSETTGKPVAAGQGMAGQSMAEQDKDAPLQLKVYKVSKRIDDDISTVCASFYLQRKGDLITSLRTGFGGMAAIPKRAHALEALVTGNPVTDELLTQADAALAADFQPISDARASSGYRLQLVQNLFRRLCIETGESPIVNAIDSAIDSSESSSVDSSVDSSIESSLNSSVTTRVGAHV